MKILGLISVSHFLSLNSCAFLSQSSRLAPPALNFFSSVLLNYFYSFSLHFSFSFCFLWSPLLFFHLPIPTFSTARRKKTVLFPPSFSLSCVFILQVEVGDFFNVGCCMLPPLPFHPLGLPLHPLFIYTHPPSLISKHPEVAWEGSGGRKASLGLP